MKVGVAYSSLGIVIYVLLIFGELEGPRDTKPGTLSMNDVQMVLKKFEPNPPDGGAIT